MYAPMISADALAAEATKRPVQCIVKHTPSKGSTLKRFNKPTTNINRFDINSPIVQRYKSKLIDVLFEAEMQNYLQPDANCIQAIIRSFKIVDDQKLGIKSISPIQEGGIAFEMMYVNKYIHLQFDNEGDAALYVEEPAKNPEGWDLTFSQSLKKLKELLS
ncbi:hypothetical protein ACJVDH_00425 [Pedobacter sp. AW1-32]|uniref:hypothetical protein n=1 Tax=Pedobacter sp. AW1-32 TaxID=3383026 RepID=UPI003FEFD013